uniref:Uncharacterized protein n=2 Tax=viral metagenome TaxID=1070528 RepID=A0A6M3KTD2_9ZZZZ
MSNLNINSRFNRYSGLFYVATPEMGVPLDQFEALLESYKLAFAQFKGGKMVRDYNYGETPPECTT